ncbi:hypothetical protein VTJ83DRAFT_2523 [Remersonia thermophila]|uniref:Uncharacterized protein n=1 Tax=Remersonia thermophila TaxID=72144 RepID=A0ABR4DJ39_9PEZI
MKEQPPAAYHGSLTTCGSTLVVTWTVYLCRLLILHQQRRAATMSDRLSTSTASSLGKPEPSSTPYSLPPAYAALSFHKADTLRLLNLPSDTVSAFEPLILATRGPGIEKQYPSGQAYEYKLKGRPFGTFRAEQLVGGIHRVRAAFALLRRHGWDLSLPVVCSSRYTAKDTLVFRRSPAALPEVERFVLAPQATHRLRLIYDGAAGSGQDPRGHLASLHAAEGGWSRDTLEFVLKGRPWAPRLAESVKVRVLLLRLLATMEEHGWRPYTRLVQRTGRDGFGMPDTWYFVREVARGVVEVPSEESWSE